MKYQWLTLIIVLIISCKSEVREQPNIIYIMVDDLGYGDFSCYGQTHYQTTHIDSFAKENLKFNVVYSAAPVCTPTRVAFMTGQYPARHSLGLREPLTMSDEDFQLGLSPDIPTISSLLKTNGYETALFGKWHLGFKKEFFPTRHGFDTFFGIIAGAADYIDHRPINRNGNKLIKGDFPILYENNTPIQRNGYLTDLITQATTNFIRQEHTKPFFISIQYTAPHWPWQTPESNPVADTLDYQTTGSFENFSSMMVNLDDNIGKILQSLKAEGYYDNTIIILTSDNGGDKFSSMGPFKGNKSLLWEGGLRVPAIVRWPNLSQPGSESNQPVITMDWTTTILDAANITLPKTLHLDGMSLIKFIANPKQLIPRTFYWRTSNRIQAHALRKGDWKYLHTKEGEFLFNLSEDPHETTNLITHQTEKSKELKIEYSNLNAQMLDPIILDN